MFFFSKGLLLNSFNDMFTLAHHIHPYNTRNSSNCNFYIPLVRTNIRKFSVRFQGPKFFNSLDSQIKSPVDLPLSFPKASKDFFVIISSIKFFEVFTLLYFCGYNCVCVCALFCLFNKILYYIPELF